MVSASVSGRSRGAPDDAGAFAAPVHAPSWRLVVACVAVLSAPLVVALASFRRPLWTPVLDLAMTELRVRDVGGSHTPLVGLPGRIGTLEQQGSHPGPLSFYALAPVYRLLGSSAWALQVATLLIHVVAMGVALAIADRRGGRRVVIALAVLLAVLTSGYGGGVLTEPWNPYLPVLWWVVVLLAVWSVLCNDLPMLPVAVIAGSFCAQTHIPYLGLTLGMGAVAALALVVMVWRTPASRRRTARWVGTSLALGVLLWLPPIVEQLRHDPGNAERIVDHFSDPPEAVQGLGVGVRAALADFDLTYLARRDVTSPGGFVRSNPEHRPSPARGAAAVALFGVTAMVALRRRDQPLIALHLVVGSGLVLMALSISRIFGVVWYYLTLWGWTIGLLGLLATSWTIAKVVGDRLRDGPRERSGKIGSRVLVAIGVAVVLRFTVAAGDSEHADATVVSELAAVIDDVAIGLDSAEGVATGRTGRYLITWEDSFHIGSQGYGLLNELERRGFDVGVEFGARVPATWHRVLDPAEATARVHLVVGSSIERWRADPVATEIAHREPRTATDLAEQSRIRRNVLRSLAALGLDEVMPRVDDNLFAAAIDPRVPDHLKEQMGRMLELGAPISVFVLPPLIEPTR